LASRSLGSAAAVSSISIVECACARARSPLFPQLKPSTRRQELALPSYAPTTSARSLPLPAHPEFAIVKL
jgi:hypothetical protein